MKLFLAAIFATALHTPCQASPTASALVRVASMPAGLQGPAMDGLQVKPPVTAPDASATLSSATAVPWGTIVLLGVLAFAAWVRFSDLGFGSLSHAEAWRANDSFAATPGKLQRFPPLQLALLYLWQS